jgi:hypothetical protein
MDLELLVYDLSFGFNLEVWHTSIVAFNKEFYFGTNGIVICEKES